MLTQILHYVSDNVIYSMNYFLDIFTFSGIRGVEEDREASSLLLSLSQQQQNVRNTTVIHDVNNEMEIIEDLIDDLDSVGVSFQVLIDESVTHSLETRELVSQALDHLFTPVIQIDSTARAFSVMFRQNWFISTLDKKTHLSIDFHREVLKSFFKKIKNGDISFEQMANRGYLGELYWFEYFVAYIKYYYTSSFPASMPRFTPEEKLLYNQFMEMISDYKHIYQAKERAKVFQQIYSEQDENKVNRALSLWAKDYNAFVSKLALFKKDRVPSYGVVDLVSLDSKITTLRDKLSLAEARFEGLINNLNKLNEISRKL